MYKMLLIGILSLHGLFTALSADAPQEDKDKVNARIQKLTNAVNQGNVDTILSFWTDDAVFVKPTTGETLEGKKVLQPFFQKVEKEIKERGLQFAFTISSIDFPDADTAIVQGVTEITDKNKGLLQRNARSIELAKKNGDWFIDRVSEIEVPPPPPVIAHLKELDWLIGNWIDSDEDVTITFKTEWDKFKNFIIQRFKMDVYGLDALEGIQIIGWDPIENTFRSWVYDSDGGFGSGLWSKKGDGGWQVALDYVLSDGTKASAKNIYTKIDDKSYSYASIDRKVGDKALPNVEPVTVEKEE